MDPFDYEETGDFGRWGEDFSDPNQFCRHGTFIGSWWGPDYLCHWCEMGEEPPPPPPPPTHELVFYNQNGAIIMSESGTREFVWNSPLANILRQCRYSGELDNFEGRIELLERRESGWVAVDCL